jgi:hypothetical protein
LRGMTFAPVKASSRNRAAVVDGKTEQRGQTAKRTGSTRYGIVNTDF